MFLGHYNSRTGERADGLELRSLEHRLWALVLATATETATLVKDSYHRWKVKLETSHPDRADQLSSVHGRLPVSFASRSTIADCQYFGSEFRIQRRSTSISSSWRPSFRKMIAACSV